MKLKKQKKDKKKITHQEIEKAYSEKYYWWKDNSLVNTIFIMITTFFFIFSYVEVPFMTSIHGYTVGMLFGHLSPLFYFYVLFRLSKIFWINKFKKPNWFKLTDLSYLFVFLSLIFIFTSVIYFAVLKSGEYNLFEIGKSQFGLFDKFWESDFTSKGNAWFPKNTAGGVIGILFHSIFASAISGMGTIFISSILLLISLSFIFTGNWKNLYRKRKSKKQLKKIIKETQELKTHNLKAMKDKKLEDEFKNASQKTENIENDNSKNIKLTTINTEEFKMIRPEKSILDQKKELDKKQKLIEETVENKFDNFIPLSEINVIQKKQSDNDDPFDNPFE